MFFKRHFKLIFYSVIPNCRRVSLVMVVLSDNKVVWKDEVLAYLLKRPKCQACSSIIWLAVSRGGASTGAKGT